MPATEAARIFDRQGNSTKPVQKQIANVNNKLAITSTFAYQRDRVIGTAHLLETGHRSIGASKILRDTIVVRPDSLH